MTLEFAKHFFGGKRRASTFQNITNVILLNKINNNCNLLYNCNFLHTFRIQKTWGFPKTPPIKEIRKISANKYYKLIPNWTSSRMYDSTIWIMRN